MKRARLPGVAWSRALCYTVRMILPLKISLIYIHKEKEAKALLTAFIKRNARMFRGHERPRSAFMKSRTHLYHFVIRKTERGELIPMLVPAMDI